MAQKIAESVEDAGAEYREDTDAAGVECADVEGASVDTECAECFEAEGADVVSFECVDVEGAGVESSEYTQRTSAQNVISDEEYAAEEDFLKKLPRIYLGALFAAPVWGPVHGFYATLFFYPAWLFADNMLYTLVNGGFAVWSLILTVLVFLTLIAVTVVFSLISGPIAAHEALERGKTLEEFLASQKVWAVVGIVLFVVAVVLATVYNINIRPGL